MLVHQYNWTMQNMDRHRITPRYLSVLRLPIILVRGLGDGDPYNISQLIYHLERPCRPLDW